MRHAHAITVSSPSVSTSRNTTVPVRSPIWTPVCANDVKNPRRAGGECSASSVEAPPNEGGDDQRGPPPDAVAEVAEEETAEGPHGEPDAEGREPDDRAGGRVAGDEEQLVEHERDGEAVDEEVVPLEGRADDRGRDDPLQL